MTHTDFEQLAAGYVLGALEPDDEHTFRRHLEGCATCEAAVRELESVVGALAYTATPVDPPASLRASILREVDATAAPAGRRAARPAVPAPAPVRPTRRRWSSGLVGRLAVAASIIAVIALGFWNLSLRDQNDLYQQRIAAFEQAAQLLNDPAAQTVRLQGSATGQGARATALISSPRNKGVLILENMPALRSDRVYEIWGIPNGAQLDQAIPAGVFRPSRGISSITFEVDIQPTMTFGVTEEPGPAGSRRPTTSPLLTGTASTQA
jgi:anti-sigma-K factor RskA